MVGDNKSEPPAAECRPAQSDVPASETSARTSPETQKCIARSGKLYRDRSRLYRSNNLQENMRLKALAEIYKVHSFCTALHFFANILQGRFAKLCKIKEIN